jgi:hypothetical protein
MPVRCRDRSSGARTLSSARWAFTKFLSAMSELPLCAPGTSSHPATHTHAHIHAHARTRARHARVLAYLTHTRTHHTTPAHTPRACAHTHRNTLVSTFPSLAPAVAVARDNWADGCAGRPTLLGNGAHACGFAHSLRKPIRGR